MNKEYFNFHRHDHGSNPQTPDSCVSEKDYINRTLELGHSMISTVNHGCSSEPYSFYSLASKHNLKLVYGMEMYYTDNRFEKDRKNTFHLIVMGLTRNAFKHINRISSEANKTGYYYYPRVDMELLLSLPPNEVVITTACINNRIFMGDDDWENKFLKPLHNHFKDNLFLEVQNHNMKEQKEWNQKILEIKNTYNIQLIHGNDSHYIYPEDSNDRDIFLKGKDMRYEYEESIILDFPDYDTVVQRYLDQGVLSKENIIEALDNTMIFSKSDDLEFSKNPKMPTIYKDLTVDERFSKLQSIIKEKLSNRLKNEIDKSRWQEYIDAVKYELDIIKETNTKDIRTADYFLLNYEIIKLATSKYNGVLTKTGRGSGSGFYINNLLGFTNIDRISSAVPLYPTRFMSKSRILDSKQFPDIDFNTANPEPFIKASRDILGEDGSYYMAAYGRLKAKGAFRLVCKAKGLKMEEYNLFAKNISDDEEHYAELLRDPKFGDMLKYSERYRGIIDSISPHPCAHLVLDDNISTEIGIMRTKDAMIAAIDGDTADSYGFLKNDWLTVTVYGIIDKVCKEININIPSIAELEDMVDDKVWKLYEDGITKTLNQADSNFATPLFMKYAPKNISELSAIIAAIRPGFASLLNNFLNRLPYTTGTQEVDNLLESSYHYLLYQENIMAFLIWLSMPEDSTYDIIKKISKKKFTDEELNNLKNTLEKNWLEKIGNTDNFGQVWQVVNDASRYSFNSAHSLSYAYDSLYCAYLKANYPLEYYSVVLEMYQENIEKTSELIAEFPYFNIKLDNICFRKSKGGYRADKDTNTIYKGISSIKYLNNDIGEELYELRHNNYNSFIELLDDISKKTSINTRQLDILIKLDFFREFGGSKLLLNIVDIYQKFAKIKTLNKLKVKDLDLTLDHIRNFSNKETEKTFSQIDNNGLMTSLISQLEDENISIKLRIETEKEYTGTITYTNDKINYGIYYVSSFKTYSDRAKPYVDIYQIRDGKTIRTKVYDRKVFVSKPFKAGSIIYIDYVDGFANMPKYRLGENGQYIKTEETQIVIKDYDLYG